MTTPDGAVSYIKQRQPQLLKQGEGPIKVDEQGFWALALVHLHETGENERAGPKGGTSRNTATGGRPCLARGPCRQGEKNEKPSQLGGQFRSP